MAKKLQINYWHTTSASIGSLSKYEGYYLARYGRLITEAGGSLYKSGGLETDISRVSKTTKKTVTRKRIIPDIEVSYVVPLGGTFEKIGEDDEAIGGGNQKVGSAIQ